MKALSFALLGIAGLLAACGSQPDQTPVVDPNAWSNTTNVSMCTGAPPAGLSIIGSWQQSLQNGAGDVINSIITIASNSTTISATCKFPSGLSIAVTMAPSATELVNSNGTNEYIVPSNYAATQSGVDPNGVLQICPVSLSENTAIVSAQGPCILLTYADGSTQLLTPITSN